MSDKHVFKVLHVDDEEDNHKRIKAFFRETDCFEKYNFEVKSFADFESAIDWVRYGDVDFAILDVHDNSDDDPELNPDDEDQMGEKLLEAIKEVRFFPVIFYTGFSRKVEHLVSPVVRVVQKGEGLDLLESPIKDLIDSGVVSLRKYIENSVKDYMWGEIDKPDLTEYLTDKNSDNLSLMLSRNLASKLSRESVKEALGMPLDTLLPVEFYRFPVPDDFCSPGAIVKDEDGEFWMVLTPSCDFAQNKAASVLMAKVEGITNHPVFVDLKTAKDELDELFKIEEENRDFLQVEKLEKKIKNKRDLLKGFCKNSSGPERYRFLPGTFFLTDSYVDFQKIKTVDVEAGGFASHCVLDTPFAEEMLTFFSRYYGRIGTPDLDQKLHWKEFEGKYSEVK